jgi:hypothetical protein
MHSLPHKNDLLLQVIGSYGHTGGYGSIGNIVKVAIKEAKGEKVQAGTMVSVRRRGALTTCGMPISLASIHRPTHQYARSPRLSLLRPSTRYAARMGATSSTCATRACCSVTKGRLSATASGPCSLTNSRSPAGRGPRCLATACSEIPSWPRWQHRFSSAILCFSIGLH